MYICILIVSFIDCYHTALLPPPPPPLPPPLAQTKDDEIAFLTNMYEEKVKALMSIDLGSDAFASAFSNELALALRDIRGEYEAIMEATRTQVWLSTSHGTVCLALLQQPSPSFPFSSPHLPFPSAALHSTLLLSPFIL